MNPSPPQSPSSPRTLFCGPFKYPSTQSSYLIATLLEERAKYISHLVRHGVPPSQIERVNLMQRHAVRSLNMREPRPIRAAEVEEAGSRCAAETALRRGTKLRVSSAKSFIQA